MASDELRCGVLRTNPAVLSIDIEGNAVEVVAGADVTESELRKAVNSIQFKPWLKNIHSEREILTSESTCVLKKVLSQGVDCFGVRVVSLKFKVDVADKATGSKGIAKAKLSDTRNSHCFMIRERRRSSGATAYAKYSFSRLERLGFGASLPYFSRAYRLFGAMDSRELHSSAPSTYGGNPTTLSVDIQGSAVEVVAGPGVTDSELRKAVDSILFKQWIQNMQSEKGILAFESRFLLKKVLIQGVDMFGERVGFLKFKADVVDKATGVKLPGIVFARGGAVAVLMLLECGGESYVVLTEQARVPVGRTILELPAGMLDDDKGDFVGTAAREVEEETGIHISATDLVNLTGFLDPSTGCKMFPSAGGCDEEISLLLYRGHVKREVVETLHGQETGLRDEGELIKLHLVPYRTLWRVTADAKALAAITLYEMAKKDGILPIHQNSPGLSNQ